MTSRSSFVAIVDRAGHVRIQDLLATADSQALDRELRLPWAKRFEQPSQREAQPHTVAESVLQVALHTAHHRGQVCRHLRHVSGEPPLIDFISRDNRLPARGAAAVQLHLYPRRRLRW